MSFAGAISALRSVKRSASSRPGNAYYRKPKRVKRTYRRRRRRRGRRFRKRGRPRYHRRRRRLPFSISQKGVFPFSTTRTLTYATVGTLSPSAGGTSTWTFKMNSCWDPDLTGAGHQPYGFDQMMTYYRTFTVIGCKANVYFQLNNDNENNIRAWAYTYIDSNVDVKSYAPTNYEQLVEYPGVQFHATGDEPTSLTRRWSAKKFFKVKGLLPQSGSAFSGTASADPADKAYLHVGYMSTDTITQPTSTKVFVKLQQIVVFTNPIDVGQS